MNVVFHGLFGKMQLRCNFLISIALRDERHQLLLTPSQARLDLRPQIGEGVTAPGNVTKQRKTEFGGAHGLSLMNRSHCGHNIKCRRILKNVSDRARPNRSQKSGFIINHVDQNQLEPGHRSRDFLHEWQIGPVAVHRID